MSFLRRAALRALTARPVSTSPSASLLSTSRTYVTCSRSVWRPQPQWTLTQFQRAYSEETKVTEEEEAAEAEATSASEPLAEVPGSEEAAAESSAPTAEAETVTKSSEPTIVSSQPAEDASIATATSAAASAAAATSSFPPTSATDAPPPQRLPFGTVAANNVLYIGNIFFETTAEDLKKFFEEFGEITESKIIYDQRGLSKGFGYITFTDLDSATRALEARNQEIFQGRRVTVQYHRPRAQNLTTPREPAKPSRTLFIGNMSFEMSDKDLNDLFREIRNVLDVRVAIDRRSGQPRGFAHADFVDEPSATKAMAILRNKEIYGRKLRVDYSVSHGGNMKDRARERQSQMAQEMQ